MENNTRRTIYRLRGKAQEVVDQGQISLMDRAAVILGAHSRCQMCGKSVEKHRIALVVDHKKPRDWGGTNHRYNLWAICETHCGEESDVFLTPSRLSP